MNGFALTGVATTNQTYTIGSPDLEALLAWARIAFTLSPPTSPGNVGILQTWLHNLVNGTRPAVAQMKLDVSYNGADDTIRLDFQNVPVDHAPEAK